MSDKDTSVKEDEAVAEVVVATKPEWPFDPYGFTNSLRRELARAIGRVQAHPEKAEILRETLRAGAKHLHARLPVQQLVKDGAQRTAEAQAAANAARAKARQVGGPAPKTDAVEEGRGNAVVSQAAQ